MYNVYLFYNLALGSLIFEAFKLPQRGYFFRWSKRFMPERPECLGYLGPLRARRGNRAGLKIKAGLQYASQGVPLEDLSAAVASRHLASIGLDLDFT